MCNPRFKESNWQPDPNDLESIDWFNQDPIVCSNRSFPDCDDDKIEI